MPGIYFAEFGAYLSTQLRVLLPACDETHSRCLRGILICSRYSLIRICCSVTMSMVCCLPHEMFSDVIESIPCSESKLIGSEIPIAPGSKKVYPVVSSFAGRLQSLRW